MDLNLNKQWNGLWRGGVASICVRSFLIVLIVAAAGLQTHSTEATNRVRGSITYMRDEVPDVPWAIHIVKVSRAQGDLRFETTLGLGKQIGMGLVSDQVKALPVEAGRPLAAINGDFYNTHHPRYPGDPDGLQIARGELVSAPTNTRSCFWIDGAGNPHVEAVQSLFAATLSDGTILPFGLNEARRNGDIVLYTRANGSSTRTSGGGLELVLTRGGETNWLPLRIGQTYTARVRKVRTDGNAPLDDETIVLSAGTQVSPRLAGVKVGDTLKIATTTKPNQAGSPTAIGGGPALVHEAKARKFDGIPTRHPRTAVGWSKQFFFLVEVDGRQKTSAGMSYQELATYMANLGCDEAINLDGGGSATIWVYGQVMNNPSEGQQRPAANALVIVRKDQAD
ncbi:MAG TPA: phosphodiester glycosidase family protein [Candidatus Limnocylindria bacterium]|nr:phosphodiester glycosidase family protein [Candidatus Limnocylindria bacterium]